MNPLEILKLLPVGAVVTYSELARALSIHPRVAAQLLARNQDSSIPCYKVIKSDGSIGGYNGILGKKETLLLKESV